MSLTLFDENKFSRKSEFTVNFDVAGIMLGWSGTISEKAISAKPKWTLFLAGSHYISCSTISLVLLSDVY